VLAVSGLHLQHKSQSAGFSRIAPQNMALGFFSCVAELLLLLLLLYAYLHYL
jgi:hypothetical protein